MSFSIQFTARDIHDARYKLQQVWAPGSVKAMIEAALHGAFLQPPRPADEQKAEALRPQQGIAAGAADAGTDRVVTGRNTAYEPNSSVRKPQVLGVHVEAWGHIADPHDGGTSEIQKFLVKPLIA